MENGSVRPDTRIPRAVLLASLAVCAVLFVRFNAGMYGSRGWEGPARANAKLAIAASETGAAQLPPGLIASEFDALVSLYTGRAAIPLLPLMAANYLRPRTPPEAAEQLSAILDAYHPRFLLVGSGEALDAARLLAHVRLHRASGSAVSPSVRDLILRSHVAIAGHPAASTMTSPARFTPVNSIDSLPRLRGRTPMDPAALLLSVLIPVYNERATIELILDQVHAVPVKKEIICVDDFSTDGTREMLQRMKDSGRIDKLIFHEINRGKGAAIRTALAASTGNVVIVQDADLEYDPADWPTLLEPILDGRADAVFGSRFLGGPHRVLYFWHSVGNLCLTTFSNMLTNLNLTDMETCYKAIRGDIARALHLTSDRFGFEPEITARLSRAKVRIFEVPISYSGRTYAEGKKIGWRDGVAAIVHILRFNLFA